MTQGTGQAGHPGRLLKKEIRARGFTQKEVASILEISAPHLSDIINGKRELSAEVAVRLERVFPGVDASFWNNAQARYNLDVARKSFEEQRKGEDFSQEELGIIDSFLPKKYLEEMGIWSSGGHSSGELLKEIFCVNRLSDIRTEFEGNRHAYGFFRESKHQADAVHRFTWEHLVKHQAKKVNVGEYSEDNFPSLVEELKEVFWEHFRSPKANVPQLAREVLTKFGIVFVLHPKPPKGPFDGYAFRLEENRPGIAMTLRYKRLDNFAFTLFHELGHLKLHLFSDNYSPHFDDKGLKGSGGKDLKDIEDEANQFAKEELIPSQVWDTFFYHGKKTDQSILHFAKTYKVHPGILRGRLCFEVPSFYKRKTAISKLNKLSVV